jgi:hypothetical protein
MKRIGLVAGLAAFAATAVLAVTRDARTSSGPLGPEGVPTPAAPSAARVRRVTRGQRIDGISCQPSEAVLFHIHAHLTIFAGGAPRRVPAGIGIGGGSSCFMWLHTHAADGIIHTESPVERVYTLGDFFDVWGAPLDRHRVGDARGPVTAFVDGRVYTGDPRRIPLLAHAQIQLDVGRPVVAPERITFPQGL